MVKYPRVKGTRFLFTLIFLLAFSSGFLAFLICGGGPEYCGSAAALEQPVTPPPLSPDAAAHVSPKKPIGGKPAATLESPETPVAPLPGSPVGTPEKTEPPAGVKMPARVSGPETQTETKEAKDLGPETVNTKPRVEKVVTPKVHDVHSGTAVASTTKENKVETKTPVAKPEKKSRKGHRAPKPVVDETQVPPEWNWFAAPLRMSMQDHKVEIVSDIKPLESEKAPLVKASETMDVVSDSHEEIVAAQDSGVTELSKGDGAVSAVAPFTTTEEPYAYKQRLVNILARFQQRREKRVAEASAHALVLPSAKGDSHSSPAPESDSKDASESSEGGMMITPPTQASDGLPPMPPDFPADDSGK